MSTPIPSPPPERMLRYWPVKLAVAIGWLLAHMPWALARYIGILLGKIMQAGMIARRNVAFKNIALCFPELSAIEHKYILRTHFQSLGIGVFEFLRAWWGNISSIDQHYQLKGLEHVQTAQAKGHGVILVSPHFTTLEICMRLMCRHVELAGIYRPHESPVLERAVRRGRERYARAMFSRNELRPAIRYLKSGGVLWFAPDQDTRRGESVFVPFFGQPAWSLTSTHQLARLSGAAVLPLFHKRLADGSYYIEIGAPLENFPSHDPVADTAHVMAVIEASIRRAPAQYLWIHQRFKRRPQGVEPLY